ncbi:EF-hand domain-containing protein [Luteimonas aestuarii]|uniref:EF-hand domain-containing protein n=2 Tax=Luteimonas aestuarii TaxID=453837 RepID=A0A4R5U1R6_9GAMM|nr:EF-hand domain-containing protein [Luteimonas aestuarii]
MVALILLLVAGLRWAGVAGLNGTEPRQMDWNADGEVSRVEILQAYTTVVVHESVDGDRSCRSYARLRDRDNPIRVDCRVTPGGASAATE